MRIDHGETSLHQVLKSAKPVFLGETDAIYDDKLYMAPKIWSYEKYSDGAIRIHWISRDSRKEKLVLLDSGFHPVSIPPASIVTIRHRGVVLPSAPTEIHIPGANSAFLRDAVTLIPYQPRKENPPTTE